MTEMPDFASFLASWKESIINGQPNTTELGRRFAHKIVTQWLDAGDSGLDLVYCDGACDGGVDLALLDMGEDDQAEATHGHTWYIVQSKYGSAFQGTGTLLVEAQKVIETLTGERARLNSFAEGLLERVTTFRGQAGPNDRIVLVFATERALNEGEKKVLDDIRTLGRKHLGGLFDVESVSVETIYARLADESVDPEAGLHVRLTSHAVPSGDELLVGSTRLNDLYRFLMDYRKATGDLDRVYEKNVRRFLGGRGKVNKGMQATLQQAPERFGLYNNGITIVASDWRQEGAEIELVDPYIVNGCQTSRTIWEVFDRRFNAGGTGVNPELEAWKEKAGNGSVVTKIVKVGAEGEMLLQAITRYTNSQNAVREKDFLALSTDFRSWQAEMADQYDIYLEVQRGGWDSQKALQNANPATHQYTKHVNAADLIKVFGAGWLGEAGTAFGKNPPFLPDGAIFKRIVAIPEDGQSGFGVADLYAAYLLQEAADGFKFGRGGESSRRQSRFLFYMVTIHLLHSVLSGKELPTDNRSLSVALAKVLTHDGGREALLNQAISVIDSYFTQGDEYSVFREGALMNSFNGDLNAFLKSEKFGKSRELTPNLFDSIAVTKRTMGMPLGGVMPAKDAIFAALVGG